MLPNGAANQQIELIDKILQKYDQCTNNASSRIFGCYENTCHQHCIENTQPSRAFFLRNTSRRTKELDIKEKKIYNNLLFMFVFITGGCRFHLFRLGH